MKKAILVTAIIPICIFCKAQNIGIGTAEPQNKLQVHGSLVVTAPTIVTATSPTAPQTKTIVNASTIAFLNTDSTGRIYDPGGPAGNYNANLLGYVNIPAASNCVGIELTAETMGLGTGDSLIIKETSSSISNLLAVGNGYTTTTKWVFNSSSLYIIFKSNADANTGIGFSLLFKRLYDNSASLPDVSGATGSVLFFDTKSGSFRSGLVNNGARGIYSVAIGNNTTASGNYSTALGSGSFAAGNTSTAIGQNTLATGSFAIALGTGTTARGDYSTTAGYYSNAEGDYSTAIGFTTNAMGNYSTTMGRNTVAAGYASTAMGDNTHANGNYSTATGYGNTVNGVFSFASGYNNSASGNYSMVTGSTDTASGDFSFASGYRSKASGNYSTAMGSYTYATGSSSTALGYLLTASGTGSAAIGGSSTASGEYSIALGGLAFAYGDYSTSIGLWTTSSGDYSTAIGSYVSTNGQDGSFVIGDNSTTTVLNSANANNFRARFAGGYRLFTSANLSTGCTLFAGDNAWTTGSDVRTKENFAEVNGEEFLRKIAGFHLTSWNYKTQDPKTFRHYGPMAQDFYAAFGKDKYGTIGNDTTINSSDLAGVSFIAIQALEKRTTLQQQQIEQLNTVILQLRKELDELRKTRE